MQTSALGTGDGGAPVAVLAAPPPPGPSYDYPPPNYDDPTGAPMDNMNALDVREEGFIQSYSKYHIYLMAFYVPRWHTLHLPLSLLPLTPPLVAQFQYMAIHP